MNDTTEKNRSLDLTSLFLPYVILGSALGLFLCFFLPGNLSANKATDCSYLVFTTERGITTYEFNPCGYAITRTSWLRPGDSARIYLARREGKYNFFLLPRGDKQAKRLLPVDVDDYYTIGKTDMSSDEEPREASAWMLRLHDRWGMFSSYKPQTPDFRYNFIVVKDGVLWAFEGQRLSLFNGDTAAVATFPMKEEYKQFSLLDCAGSGKMPVVVTGANGKKGLIYEEELLPCAYDSLGTFEMGNTCAIKVYQGENVGLYNIAAKHWVLPLDFNDFLVLNDSLCRVFRGEAPVYYIQGRQVRGKQGIYDFKNNQLLIPPEYDFIFLGADGRFYLRKGAEEVVKDFSR